MWTLLKTVLCAIPSSQGVPACCLWESFPLQRLLVSVSSWPAGSRLREGPSPPRAQCGPLALPHPGQPPRGQGSLGCCSSCWGGEGKVEPCLTNPVTACAEGTVVVSASGSWDWVSRAAPKPGCRTGFRVWVISGTGLVLGVVLAPVPEAHHWWRGSTLSTFADGETWLVLQRDVLGSRRVLPGCRKGLTGTS